jgi:hypothetical protein
VTRVVMGHKVFLATLPPCARQLGRLFVLDLSVLFKAPISYGTYGGSSRRGNTGSGNPSSLYAQENPESHQKDPYIRQYSGNTYSIRDSIGRDINASPRCQEIYANVSMPVVVSFSCCVYLQLEGFVSSLTGSAKISFLVNWFSFKDTSRNGFYFQGFPSG